MRFWTVALLIALVSLGSPAAQGTEVDIAPDPVWRPADFVQQPQIGDITVSSDGTLAVWVERRPCTERQRMMGRLRMASLDDEVPPRALTDGTASDSNPQLSPDATLVAFLSDRPLPGPRYADGETSGQDQVWVMPGTGGAARPVTMFGRGVRAFAWLDDDTLVVVAPPDPSLQARALDASKDDTKVVEDVATWIPVRLWTVSVDKGSPEALTRNDDEIDLFAVDRVHRRVAARHLPGPYWEADHRGLPRLTLTDVDSHEVIEMPVSRDLLPENLTFTGNGSTVLSLYLQTSRPDLLAAGRTRLAYWRPDMKVWRSVDSPNTDDEALGLAPTTTGAIVRMARGTETMLTRLARSGEGFRLDGLTGDAIRQVAGFAVSADGRRLVVERSRASRPPELRYVAADGPMVTDVRQLAAFHRDLRGKPIARTEIMSWAGAQGETVEGLLYRPTHHTGSGPAPLVVMIHGGPASADRDLWDEDWASAANAYCQRGAWVLKPNYHGSTGYGREFAESIAGRYYELEVPDILAGIDTLVERGLVDPDRVGLVGWSNGAILAIALGLERPFAAIVAGAGDVNWTSDFGNCAFGAWFDRYYIGDEPWTDTEGYIAKSPLFRLDRNTSPTLILFGAEDTSVPTSQGWEHYRALQQMDRAPVRFVLFPDEPHSLKNLVHRQRKLTEELAWMDRHLFGREPAESLELPPGSALRAAQLAAQLEPSDELTPPTARVAALPMLEIGLTEITNAQWSEFTGADIPKGAGDLPLILADPDAMEDFCRWLGRRTGRTWRPLTAAEHGRLRGACRETVGTPNTLDAWAGSELTRDDAEAVRKVALRTPGLPALLRPVSSTSACTVPAHRAGPWDPEVAIFGLEGNLAEHVTTKEGSAGTAGGSVVRAEVEAEDPTIAGEPVGLRLAVEIPLHTQEPERN